MLCTFSQVKQGNTIYAPAIKYINVKRLKQINDFLLRLLDSEDFRCPNQELDYLSLIQLQSISYLGLFDVFC